ncbi:uncharacterized protein ALTATR162_LOCUS6904 [Alternaria atra]|uniref:Uncharacterized protein n=1 Tax=Alternaria atra TaxID=119953 RepID=A0A8J2I3E7_9PLEO|nr:uncharacterized protein ALTATR162_LOCUS6904 [Alternaria atra]CAG5166281.1 unnamed protein product [Alternaria atra]
MQRLLPRELRDMVYVVIFGKPGEYDIRFKSDNHNYNACTIPDSWWHYLCDPVFLDQETLTELAHTWYRQNMFLINQDFNVACLFTSSFRVWDLAHLDLVRSIRHVCFDLCPKVQWMETKDSTIEGKADVRLPSDFEQLANLQPPATVTIRINSRHWYYHGETGDEWKASIGLLSERVFPLLKQLKATGVRIAIKVGCVGPAKVEMEHLNSKGWSGLVRETRSHQLE